MHVKGWKKDGAYSSDPEKIEKESVVGFTGAEVSCDIRI